MTKPGLRVAGVLLALLVAPACGVSGLSFREDERVSIFAPGDRDEVALPVTIRWEADDLAAGTTFAVFVDRAPPPPGRSVAWLFRDDEVCARDEGCPDEEYLATRGIFVTDETEVTIERIATPARKRERDLHEATIVLIGRNGERLGESAFIREFALVDEDGR